MVSYAATLQGQLNGLILKNEVARSRRRLKIWCHPLETAERAATAERIS